MVVDREQQETPSLVVFPRHREDDSAKDLSDKQCGRQGKVPRRALGCKYGAWMQRWMLNTLCTLLLSGQHSVPIIPIIVTVFSY